GKPRSRLDGVSNCRVRAAQPDEHQESDDPPRPHGTARPLHPLRLGHLLQSVTRTVHSPALPFLQLASAASRAASRSLRAAAPAYLPFSFVANAAPSRRPGRITPLQPVAPHSLNAASAARCEVVWPQLEPTFPVSLSQAIAPYSARAGTAVSWTTPKPNRAATVRVARRIELFSSC